LTRLLPALALSFVLFVAGPAAQDPKSRPTPGDAAGTGQSEIDALVDAPPFTLVDIHGDKVRLSDFRGKVVVLHFWAEWCASCTADLRYFQTAHEKWGEQGVVVLGLAYASGSRENVARFVGTLGVTFPTMICDEQTRQLYDVASLPTNFVLDRQGRIRYVSRRLMDAAYWERVLGEMVAD